MGLTSHRLTLAQRNSTYECSQDCRQLSFLLQAGLTRFAGGRFCFSELHNAEWKSIMSHCCWLLWCYISDHQSSALQLPRCMHSGLWKHLPWPFQPSNQRNLTATEMRCKRLYAMTASAGTHHCRDMVNSDTSLCFYNLGLSKFSIFLLKVKNQHWAGYMPAYLLIEAFAPELLFWCPTCLSSSWDHSFLLGCFLWDCLPLLTVQLFVFITNVLNILVEHMQQQRPCADRSER